MFPRTVSMGTCGKVGGAPDYYYMDLICCRNPKHSGPHIAYTSGTIAVSAWVNEDVKEA